MGNPAPLELLDTHAGAGLYDLSGEAARRSGESVSGIARVMGGPPEPLSALAEAVRALNGGGEGPLYPGSPLLAAAALRPGDAYIGCELRAEVCAELARTLAGRPGRGRAEAREVDGYAAAREAVPGVRRAVLVDPPFERPSEATDLAGALGAVFARGEPALVWVPLKDLDGYDRLLGRVEAARPPAPSWAVRLLLRRPDDPMRLNGCAMLLLGGPDVSAAALAAAEAVAERCGEAGAGAAREQLAT